MRDTKRAWVYETWVLLAALIVSSSGCKVADSDHRPKPADADAAADGGNDVKLSSLACDVIVVGGGAAGLHTAFRLGDKMGKGVCLFEKESRLGGRIYDVSKDGSDKGPFIGVGARRIQETQTVVFNLADELGIEYEKAPFADDVISARGEFAGSSDELNEVAYPKVPDATDTETAMYDKLRERKNITQYPDFRSYVRGTVGVEGYQFLTDAFRFRADFAYPLDARGYLDYFDEEWDVCCEASYPVGGMSAFIRGMEKKALAAGVRIFKSEPVASIDKQGKGYVVVSKSHVATAPKLVIAVDAGGFKHIRGNIAEAIQEQQQFKDLIGVKVATITQWWPKAWWETAVPGKDVRRAWTTEHCLNHIEIPVDTYGKAQKVTRSVYDDDQRCVAFWEELKARGDTAAIEAEITRGLKYLFPEATIPAPDKTFVHIWENGWYWLRAGTEFTNADIAQWAIEPLEGEDVGLVGESYNPQRSGWSDGAYKSSIALLDAKYGFSLAVAVKASALTRGGGDEPKRHARSAGGH